MACSTVAAGDVLSAPSASSRPIRLSSPRTPRNVSRPREVARGQTEGVSRGQAVAFAPTAASPGRRCQLPRARKRRNRRWPDGPVSAGAPRARPDALMTARCSCSTRRGQAVQNRRRSWRPTWSHCCPWRPRASVRADHVPMLGGLRAWCFWIRPALSAPHASGGPVGDPCSPAVGTGRTERTYRVHGTGKHAEFAGHRPPVVTLHGQGRRPHASFATARPASLPAWSCPSGPGSGRVRAGAAVASWVES